MISLMILVRMASRLVDVCWMNDCLLVNWERKKEGMKWKRKCSAVRFITAGVMTHVLMSFQSRIDLKDT